MGPAQEPEPNALSSTTESDAAEDLASPLAAANEIPDFGHLILAMPDEPHPGQDPITIRVIPPITYSAADEGEDEEDDPTHNPAAHTRDDFEYQDIDDGHPERSHPDAEDFVLHSVSLRRFADYFQVTSTHRFRETRSRFFTLLDVYPSVFQVLYQWIYRPVIGVHCAQDADLLLVEAWILGDFIQCGDFCHAIIDFLLNDYMPSHRIGARAIERIHNGTVENSVLRNIVDQQ